MSEDKMRECPFCGHTQLDVEDGGILHWVVCRHCHAEGPVAVSHDDAINYWNRREGYEQT